MKFGKTEIDGLYIIELEKHKDERGFLARIWDKKEFGRNGIKFEPVEGYITETLKKGTIRGFHYQVEPFAENKLNRCIAGSVYEVVIDLRPNSPTFKKVLGFELKARDLKMLFVPKNLAHAILTLEDNTQFQSLYDKPYMADYEKGIRYNDPAFNIKWPIPVVTVSEKDKSWEDFNDNR